MNNEEGPERSEPDLASFCYCLVTDVGACAVVLNYLGSVAIYRRCTSPLICYPIRLFATIPVCRPRGNPPKPV